jgi:protein-tyrosine phosphatase
VPICYGGDSSPNRRVTASDRIHCFDKLSNFRDIGGLRTSDGRVVKTGVLFRSDSPHRLTSADQARMQALGIRLVCDLRSARDNQRMRPRTGNGHTPRIVNIPLQGDPAHEGTPRRLLGFLFGSTGGDRYRAYSRGLYDHIAFEQTARLKEVLTTLAVEENLPALIHCQAGKDRTGVVAAIVQLLAGVPYEAVREDYLCTNECFRPRVDRFIRVMRRLTLFQVSEARMRLVIMANIEFLDQVYYGILERYGSLETYLTAGCGMDEATLDRLRNHLR